MNIWRDVVWMPMRILSANGTKLHPPDYEQAYNECGGVQNVPHR